MSLHSLRHSYITHLIEDGYDPLFVQQQVGHCYASTTALYTSNGSARASHRSPHTAAPVNSTQKYNSTQDLIIGMDAESGLANSIHTKANNPTAAGRYPQPEGYLNGEMARRTTGMR